jgi:hypothetical protein
VAKFYAIYITKEYKKLCGKCYDEIRDKQASDPDDISYRERYC